MRSVDAHSLRSQTTDSAATSVDELALLRRLQANDSAAFEELVRGNGGRMLATARRFFQDEQDAADAVQDAFISAFKAMKTFKGDSLLATWLHRILINACLMRRRTMQRQPTVAIECLLPQFDEMGHYRDSIHTFRKSPLDALAAEELRLHVRTCIDRLPEAYREVLVLRDIEQFDTETTAKMLDASASLVKVRLHRARQALRTLLAPVMQGT
ncbi:MAG TPA: sigma-70 family RNA polymerase sigma factor [Pirellulales bacterium]|nr:sigma-70 family RNA polymerase sigma factor [Pirellulales bacterium]